MKKKKKEKNKDIINKKKGGVVKIRIFLERMTQMCDKYFSSESWTWLESITA